MGTERGLTAGLLCTSMNTEQIALLLLCTSCVIFLGGSAWGAVPVLAGVVIGFFAGRFSLQGESSVPAGSINGRRKSDELFKPEGWEGGAAVSDWEPFRQLGRSMIDYIADYYQNVEDHPVRAMVEPGYLKKRLTTKEFPSGGEKWSDIMADVDSHIMPGITHWQSPRFFAYYPAHSSPPAILGDMLSSMFNVIGFSWEASPASTELESIVLDQLARAVGLPEVFLTDGGGGGGGVIQGSASEGTVVAVLAARTKALKHMQRESPGANDSELLAKMTLYASDQAHSSIQKAANIAGLGSNLRLIPTREWSDKNMEGTGRQDSRAGGDEHDQQCYTVDAADLSEAMRNDLKAGLTPVFVSANVGSTNTCAVDPVRAMGEACRSILQGAGNGGGKTSGLVPWLHVDAAYAGSAAVCPENRWVLDGIEAADSFMFNLHKWLLVNFDCTAMWVKKSAYLVDALSVTPEILRSKEYNQKQVSDYRDWQVPLGRKFRSLKIWLTMRAFGLDKVKGLIRHHTQLAKDFENLVRKDDRFEIVAPTRFGLVCFRLNATDSANEELRSRIVASGLAFFSSTKLGGRTCLRVSVGGPATEARHIHELWAAFTSNADVVAGEGS